MKKLIAGLIDYQNNITPEEKQLYVKLALGQAPDALLITCADSRVAPNVFASTDPGDLFVVRNVGNLISPCPDHNHASSDSSEAAALEFAISNLKIKDIIICGHSECGAMQALLHGRDKIDKPNLKTWLRHGEPALNTLRNTSLEAHNESIAPHNHLSQINVLQQIEHLKTYDIVNKKIALKELQLHGWWFDIKSATVHWFLPFMQKFIPINEKNLNSFEHEFNLK